MQSTARRATDIRRYLFVGELHDQVCYATRLSQGWYATRLPTAAVALGQCRARMGASATSIGHSICTQKECMYVAPRVFY